jgi:antitoxin component of MazEF toxin-antitoxin module
MDQSHRIAVDTARYLDNTCFMEPIQLLKLGDDVALPLPDAWLQRIGVKIGDTIWASITPEGVDLTAQKPKRARRATLIHKE